MPSGRDCEQEPEHENDEPPIVPEMVSGYPCGSEAFRSSDAPPRHHPLFPGWVQEIDPETVGGSSTQTLLQLVVQLCPYAQQQPMSQGMCGCAAQVGLESGTHQVQTVVQVVGHWFSQCARARGIPPQPGASASGKSQARPMAPTMDAETHRRERTVCRLLKIIPSATTAVTPAQNNAAYSQWGARRVVHFSSQASKVTARPARMPARRIQK